MSSVPGAQAAAPASGPSALRSPWLQTFVASIRFMRTWIGLGVTAAVVAVALLGPMFSPYSPTEFVAPPYEPPSNEAWLGTDYLGRDVLSRFLWGGRSVLGLSILATVFGLGLRHPRRPDLGLHAQLDRRRPDACDGRSARVSPDRVRAPADLERRARSCG